MNQWSHARARKESEIQRKMEQQNFATNFVKARGFTRTNFSTKRFVPGSNPTEVDTSTDDSDIDAKNVNLKKSNTAELVVDTTTKPELYPSSRPEVQGQIEILEAIDEYNAKIPK